MKGKIMEKKMYKQPKTEVLGVDGEYLMTISVSPGTPTDPSSPPGAGMPRRGERIP